MSAIRLNKVLRELNISIDRAIDFLESKCHQIEKRPTSKISEEIYELLCGEFQTDAENKVASKEVAEAQIKEKEELRLKKEEELDVINKKKKEQEVITAASKVTKFKKLGKIDLDTKPKKEKSIDDKKSKSKEEIKSKKEPKTKEEKQETTVADNYKKLSGLKSTGETIDLSKFKEEPPTDKQEEKTKSKKRRKRIISSPKGADQKQKLKSSGRGRVKTKKGVKEEPNEEEVQKQIKETLEKLQGKSV